MYYIDMNTFAKQPKTQKKALEKALQSPFIGKHGKRKSTLLKEEVFKDTQNIIAGRALSLMEKQYHLAIGAIKVFVVRSHWEGAGINRRLVKEKPEIIKDEQSIYEAIDYEFGGCIKKEKFDEQIKYYFVVTKEPNLKAIDSLLNRVFGKPTENKNIVVENGMGALLS